MPCRARLRTLALLCIALVSISVASAGPLEVLMRQWPDFWDNTALVRERFGQLNTETQQAVIGSIVTGRQPEATVVEILTEVRNMQNPHLVAQSLFRDDRVRSDNRLFGRPALVAAVTSLTAYEINYAPTGVSRLAILFARHLREATGLSLRVALMGAVNSGRPMDDRVNAAISLVAISRDTVEANQRILTFCRTIDNPRLVAAVLVGLADRDRVAFFHEDLDFLYAANYRDRAALGPAFGEGFHGELQISARAALHRIIFHVLDRRPFSAVSEFERLAEGATREETDELFELWAGELHRTQVRRGVSTNAFWAANVSEYSQYFSSAERGLDAFPVVELPTSPFVLRDVVLKLMGKPGRIRFSGGFAVEATLLRNVSVVPDDSVRTQTLLELVITQLTTDFEHPITWIAGKLAHDFMAVSSAMRVGLNQRLAGAVHAATEPARVALIANRVRDLRALRNWRTGEEPYAAGDENRYMSQDLGEALAARLGDSALNSTQKIAVLDALHGLNDEIVAGSAIGQAVMEMLRTNADPQIHDAIVNLLIARAPRVSAFQSAVASRARWRLRVRTQEENRYLYGSVHECVTDTVRRARAALP